MKGFGTFALIVGICWVIFALSMDVSVSTGMGRVNNLGLMADRRVPYDCGWDDSAGRSGDDVTGR